MNRRICLLPVLILASLVCLLCPQVRAQTTAFTYQGRLDAAGVPAQGPHDLVFTLFDAASGGNSVGATVATNGVRLTNGLFTVVLDFGATPFSGAGRWLQVTVSPTGSAQPPVTLQPRQAIQSTPYALRAVQAGGLPAGAVGAAMLADGAVTASKIAPGAVSQLGSPDGSPVSAVQVNTNGLVGIGTNTPQAGLHLAGGRPFFNLESIRTLRDETGGLTNLSGASGVAADGTLLAVASSFDRGVTLFNVSNPEFPAWTAQFRDGDSGFTGMGPVSRLALRSNLLAVADFGTVSLVNVSNRSAPVLVAQFRDGQGGWNELNGINSLAFSGNLLAIAARQDSAVTLVDVSNPANPIKRAELKDGFFGFTNLWGATAVAFKGNYLFIGADQDKAITVVDVTTPSNPIRVTDLREGVGGFSHFGFVQAMTVAGNTLAVGSDQKLALVDVSNPAVPRPGAILTPTTQPAIGTGVNGLASAGSLLAVAPQFGSRAVVLDVSQPAAPQVHAATDTLPGQNTYATAAFFQGNLAFSLQEASAVSFWRLAARTAGLVSADWVGIGVVQPKAALHVVGDVVVESTNHVLIRTRSVNLGWDNTVEGDRATVGGGALNRAEAQGNTIAGGGGNIATGDWATIGGGYENRASGFLSTVGGGYRNSAVTDSASVGGGYSNRAAGKASVVPGGSGNVAEGDYSAAMGVNARASHAGSFVWGDWQNTYFDSTTNNQFSVRANGGVRFETAGAGLTVDGQKVLTTPAGTRPMELSVNGQRALRLEPTVGTPNLIGGYSGNVVSNMVIGAVIGGGGLVSQVNSVGGDFATVAGGRANESFGAAAVVGGGVQNRARGQGNVIAGGLGNSTTNDWSVVGGGYLNQASGFISTIAGGQENWAVTNFATVGGGFLNNALGYGSVVPGGVANRASGDFSAAMGNQAQALHRGSFVWSDSQPGTFQSGTSNQFNIRASGGVRLNNDTSLSFGEQARQMINLWTADYGIGVQSGAQYFRTGNDFYWYRGGSHSDTTGDGGSGGVPLMSLTRSGRLGIGMTSPSYPLETRAAQAVGRFTTTNENSGSVLVLQNTMASPTYLGAINFDTDSSTVGQIGYLASDDLSFRVGGMERMRLNSGGLTVNGTFVSSSDRNVKRDFGAVSPEEVLEKVAALPIQTWSYTNHAGAKHIGPMAQDFHAAFGLGTDDKTIATVDADGVALAAIQGLNQKLAEREAALRVENEALKDRLEKLERMVDALTRGR